MDIKLNKESLFQLSIFTLFGFSAIGFALIYWAQGVSPKIALSEGKTIYIQLLLGLLFGLVAALLGLVLIHLPFLKGVSTYFDELFSRLNLNINDIIFYSFCAGVGEEILFRAGFQPLFVIGSQPIVGIAITSIIFVLAHGYISLRNWKMTFYGFYLIVISIGLGILFYLWGILSAIAAHFFYDLLMFAYLLFWKPNVNIPLDNNQSEL